MLAPILDRLLPLQPPGLAEGALHRSDPHSFRTIAAIAKMIEHYDVRSSQPYTCDTEMCASRTESSSSRLQIRHWNHITAICTQLDKHNIQGMSQSDKGNGHQKRKGFLCAPQPRPRLRHTLVVSLFNRSSPSPNNQKPIFSTPEKR
jgi:hypothetical protein